jgi:hypothetical protein
MMLTNTDALLTLAEVSATFSGFAALVTLFVHRRMEAAAAHDLLRRRLVIGASIVVVMAALIPVSIAGLGLPQTLVWQLSSAIFLTLIYFVIRSFIRSYRTVRGSFPPPLLIRWPFFSLLFWQFSYKSACSPYCPGLPKNARMASISPL